MGLDLRDKRIIRELDKNARQSIANISKRTNIPRNIVEYKIKKLVADGIITKFVTEVALGKIGYSTYKIFCQISGWSKESQKEFFQEVVQNDNFVWVAKCEGRWDLLLAVYAKNVIDFARIKRDFFLKYGKYICDYAITIVSEAYILERAYLTENKKRDAVELYVGGAEPVELDSSDKQLLQFITNNARMKLIELSKRLNLNIKTVIGKIKKLEKSGVIQGYTTFLNLNKLNFHFFKLCVYLKEVNLERYKELIKFCKNQEHVIHLIESIGPWELELEIEVSSSKEFQNLSDNLRNKFSDIVRKVESVIITDEIKLDFLPKAI
ncbi:MAG: Lrp/AsnC family transcriptional regulator [Candidatus Woesearchaeota archaeon]